MLARKYRPQQFADVVAQEHVTRTLTNALNSERISSGYLFTGPRGTGKTTVARILAKALNCVDGPTATPCDKCQSCTEIMAGSSLDVLEIDAASNTGVDDIRALRENVRYLPTSGKKRIYIIDEVHRLSGSAFDALLKTLEEPPPHVVFIFATTEPHKVPETIRSRTQRYDFHRVGKNILSEHLKKVAEGEDIIIDDDALFMLARKADGSVRDGMSLLDQLSAFAGDRITAAEVADALGLIDRRFFIEYVEAIAANDPAAGLEKVRQFVESGADISEFCSGLAEHLRNLLILKNTVEPENILELSESEIEDLAKQKDFFSTGDLLRMIKIITDMTLDIKSGLDSRLLFEVTTLRLASMEGTVSFEEILAHLSGAEDTSDDDMGTDLFGAPTQKDIFETPKQPEPKPEPRPAVDEMPAAVASTVRAVNLPIVQTNWPKFTDQVKTHNRMLAALLSMAEIREVKDNTITAVFHNAGGTSKQVLEKPDYVSQIQTDLREYFKTPLRIKYEVDTVKPAPKPEKPDGVAETVDADKLLQDDPRMKNLVDRFDGEIIGKRKVEE
ncbi:MAG: DNA polymerase III subunit gamma/tau [candidate division Zixibacteria bacterium]|nr:DNA polymerase III subunit gamma/tau [candidate division Zixibacteria bacterium]